MARFLLAANITNPTNSYQRRLELFVFIREIGGNRFCGCGAAFSWANNLRSLRCAYVQSTPQGILIKPVTTKFSPRMRGSIKGMPGDMSFAEDWTKHKAEEKALEEAT